MIVESPAKGRTIEKYLGKDFKVLASYGHVRDLAPKKGAIETENDFAMHYQPVERNERHIQQIINEVKKAQCIYLATDPDREGEAISWHLVNLLKEAGVLEGKPVYRVVFHQIIRKAVQEAVASPREISIDLVDAQQARRALDYLVGFNLSPLLWKKIRTGLSAGRVQSPALRMIVEREEEIEKFEPREYWSIHAQCHHEDHAYEARLVEMHGKKLEQFTIETEEQAQRIRSDVEKDSGGRLVVAAVEKRQRRKRPAAAFITSTLQQEAARKLGFTAQRTMRLAQKLYEGVPIDGQEAGLITYMRTDSVHIAPEAVEDIRNLIRDKFGRNMVPAKPRSYKTKSRNAQEAHEAIRPTSAAIMPQLVEKQVERDLFRLYELIWKRAVASQMIDAVYDTVAVDLLAGANFRFRVTGSVLKTPGFIQLYQESRDEAVDEQDIPLPEMTVDQTIPLDAVDARKHVTEPPPRYGEASLIKSLEEHGIGRPSTYASIIITLQQRDYVAMQQKRFVPTDVGRVVSQFLARYFNRYVDYAFTAELEDQLDAIARGERQWKPVLQSFWTPFHDLIEQTDQSVSRSEVTSETLDESCPKCGKPLQSRLGKHGRFIGCSAFPECDYTRNLDGQEDAGPAVVEGRICPKCGGSLVLRHGRYGQFIGCAKYPECRFIESLNQPQETGVTCPVCHHGNLVKKRSRRGKVFFACSDYPTCQYAIWDAPINEPCPKCGWPILTQKTTKRRGAEKVCPQKDCDYREPLLVVLETEVS